MESPSQTILRITKVGDWMWTNASERHALYDWAKKNNIEIRILKHKNGQFKVWKVSEGLNQNPEIDLL